MSTDQPQGLTARELLGLLSYVPDLDAPIEIAIGDDLVKVVAVSVVSGGRVTRIKAKAPGEST